MAGLGDQDAAESRGCLARAGSRVVVVAELQLVEPFQVEREAAAGPVDLDPQGVLAAGADADFLVLSAEGEVLRTFVGGAEFL